MTMTIVLKASNVAAVGWRRRFDFQPIQGRKLVNGIRPLILTAAAVITGYIGSARAEDIIPPKQYSMTPGGVNLSDGSFTLSDTDLSIGGLSLTRFHIGGMRDPNQPPFGPRMDHNFDIYVKPNQRTDCTGGPGTCHAYKKPVVHLGQSASGTYLEDLYSGIILYANDDATSGNLERNASNNYVYTDQAGAIYTFNSSDFVENIVFPDGRRQDFLYSGKLKAVIDSSGYAIVFDYLSNGHIGAACGYNLADIYVSASTTCTGAALKVGYGYSVESVPMLTTVTDTSSNVTTYSYNNTSPADRREITCVKPPGYSSCKISNVYSSWHVTQQTLADGAVWNFSYNGDYSKARSPEAYSEVDVTTYVIVTDPALKQSEYYFAQSSPYSALDANGRMTYYTYGGGADYSTEAGFSTRFGSFLFEAELPEGNKYTAYFGPRRVIGKETMVAKLVGGVPSSPDIVNDVGFPTSCDAPNTRQNCTKPLWRKDAKGNQTDYSYMSNGLLLTEMQPSPVQLSLWTGGTAASDKVRLLKLNTYIQKTAAIKNSSGTLTSAASAIWLPSTETLCQTASGSSSPVCDAAAPQTVTTYDYGPAGTANNLLLRSKVVVADGGSLKTCYGYDSRGRKIWERSPRGLGACP